MAVGRCQHDKQLIEAAEPREKRPERGDGAAIAREKAEDVRVECNPPCADDGCNEQAGRGRYDDGATTRRPSNDGMNGGVQWSDGPGG